MERYVRKIAKIINQLNSDENGAALIEYTVLLAILIVAVIVIITGLLVLGIRESARFNNFIVAVKLVVIVLFVAFAAPAFSTANWVTSQNPDLGEAKESLAKGFQKSRPELDDLKEQLTDRGSELYDDLRKQGAALLETLTEKGSSLADSWMERARPRRRRFGLGKALLVLAVVGVGIAVFAGRD